MGTTYDIFTKQDCIFELDEHSNKFDLCISISHGYLEIPDLTPEDIESIIARLAEVLSYWDDSIALKKRLFEKISKKV